MRDTLRVSGKSSTANVRIDVEVTGESNGTVWTCGFEFDYANSESFVCRPVRLPGFDKAAVKDAEFSEIPVEASKIQVAYLPPMSGLASDEPKWEQGRVNVLIGQGQTAQVLRNLCFQLWEAYDETGNTSWVQLTDSVRLLFGVELQPPLFLVERGEIAMSYHERGVELDLSCAGRGLQQTLLLLAYLYAHPRTVVLLDEPDAHLEILRQREMFQWLTRLAAEQQSQVIAASHSEVVLNEGAAIGTVVAFVGAPHRMNAGKSQVLKSLSEIGFEDYYTAEETGWFLYLENETDLLILQEFAKKLAHPSASHLQRPCVHRVTTNLPRKARDHFYGLREAKPDLIGVAIFDRIDSELVAQGPLIETCWTKREIENYFCTQDVLLRFVAEDVPDDLFGRSERAHRQSVMLEAIQEINDALSALGKPTGWSSDVKASDEFMEPVFRRFSDKLGIPLVARKGRFYELVKLMKPEEVDAEVREKLDLIHDIATRSQPRK